MHAALPRHIAAYYDTLKSFERQGAATEGATRIAFQTLLSEAGRKHGFTVLGEQTVQLAGKKSIRFDGEVKDKFKIHRRLYWGLIGAFWLAWIALAFLVYPLLDDFWSMCRLVIGTR